MYNARESIWKQIWLTLEVDKADFIHHLNGLSFFILVLNRFRFLYEKNTNFLNRP